MRFFLSIIWVVFTVFGATTARALSFGTYDARALAMGGTTVAAARSGNAQFYNPALLSFEDEDEDYSRNGRIVAPSVVAMVSDAGESAADIVADGLLSNISDVIDNYNQDPNNQEVQLQALNTLVDFDEAVDTIAGRSVEAEATVALAVSEPAIREGGSFYFAARGIIFGRANVSQQDRDLTDRYINVLEVISSGGMPSAQDRADLFDGDELRDPRPQLTSDANIASLEIREWGLALSKEVPIFGVPIALGITPKAMNVKVFREALTFADEDIPSYKDNTTSKLAMNVDLGIATELFGNVRFGLAAKDVFSKSFEAPSGLEVEIKPRARIGVAYVTETLTFGWDIDITSNRALVGLEKTKETSFGLEYRLRKNLDLRLGYRQFTERSQANVVSAGIGYQLARFIVQGSFAVGEDANGGAMQFGWTF